MRFTLQILAGLFAAWITLGAGFMLETLFSVRLAMVGLGG